MSRTKRPSQPPFAFGSGGWRSLTLCTQMKTKNQSLSWAIPFSVHRKKTIQEIRQTFPFIAFVRIVIAFTVVFLPIRFLLPRCLPDLDVDWTQLYFISLLSMFGIIIPVCLGAFCPPRITIKPKGVFIQSAQRSILYRFADIATIRVDETTKPFATLRICLLEQLKDKEYPIAPTIPIIVLATRINELRLNR